MVVHAFNLSTQQADLCEFQASLVYTVSFRTFKGIMRPSLAISNNSNSNNNSEQYLIQQYAVSWSVMTGIPNDKTPCQSIKGSCIKEKVTYFSTPPPQSQFFKTGWKA